MQTNQNSLKLLFVISVTVFLLFTFAISSMAEDVLYEEDLTVKYFKNGYWVGDHREFSNEITFAETEGTPYYRVLYDENGDIVQYEKYNAEGDKLFSVTTLTILILSGLHEEGGMDLTTDDGESPHLTQEGDSQVAVENILEGADQAGVNARFFKTLAFINDRLLDEITANQASQLDEFYIAYYDDNGDIVKYEYFRLDDYTSQAASEESEIEPKLYKLYEYDQYKVLQGEKYYSNENLLFEIQYSYGPNNQLELSEAFRNNQRIFYFDYDRLENGQLDGMYYYQYDSETDQDFLVSYEIYRYDDEGKIEAVDEYNSEDELIKVTFYNEDQRVNLEHLYSTDETGEMVLSSYWVYTYDENNDLVEKVRYNENGEILESVTY